MNTSNTEKIFISPLAADPSEVPEISITDYLFESLKKNDRLNSEKPWVIDAHTGVQVLFRQIEPDSKKIASALARLGFEKGDVLHFVTYETAQLYLLQVAVWRLGGTVRGCYQLENTEEYVRQLKETGARFILVDDETEEILQKSASHLEWPVTFFTFGKSINITSVKSLMDDDGTACPENLKINCKEDVIFIPNTSGSTGVPKGVLHTHYSTIAFNHHPNSLEHLNYDFMTPMSNFAMGSYVVSIASLLRGSTIIHLGKFQRENYIANMLKFKPGNCLMYPFVATWFARCEELAQTDLSFVKIITVGGGVLDPTTAELLSKKMPCAKIVRVYASSETLDIANTLIDSSLEKLIFVKYEGQLCISSGKLLPNVQAKIIDFSDGQSLEADQVGEICIRSPYLMKGYLCANSDSGIQVTKDEEGWLHTGDVGFFDTEGRIFITERLGFMFKYYMFIVSPTEIEAVLQEHPGVQSVGVVGVPNPSTTCLARAFVVKQPGFDVTEEELCEFVKQKLPDYKHLHGGVEFLEKLPESKGNKLDRVALKRLAEIKIV
ncbi:uncharacterized protein LOC132202040 [Neocloeon triangulifer]|uniref:uncharacterized protein LOC132202040 n=1 Tax=Neocloeon triangulifer TaxID=2078957 RepID=UPI00286F41EB|nr:uncharacterized protein LOC132202040 [Neocloeon triangulifer]XP_059484666.1 uncharacterized protein LOC132202040 [Neocloeon triangulifer]XP_059484667.1 uncharacterized protein LOC132202040 [Neocloeon triangulifer]XP_059484668.1 uncharacterized protein LOC132202040 [Neocloeon triangulifer]